MIYGLTEGRIVHFVPGEGAKFRATKAHLVGIIVRIWDRETGCCNIRLLVDGTNDLEDWPLRPQDEWVTSVSHDEEGKKPYSWHYPEKVV